MRKHILISTIAVSILVTTAVGAAPASKSISQMKKLSEKNWLKQLEGGCTPITYGGKLVGNLCPASTPTPEPNPNPTPNPDPIPQPQPQPSALDFTNWTLMLPTGGQGDPDNDYPAKTGEVPNVFFKNTDGSYTFRTRVDGVHSPNSQYPRTELREMKDANWGKAAWSNKSGTHTLELRQAITHTPVAKPHVVSAQIHDGSDDVMQVRLEGKELAVHYNDGNSKVLIDPNYQVGTFFDVKIEASGSRIKVSYNGVQKADIAKSGSNWYFKTGCYVQSNPSKGDVPDAYGEVVISKMVVEHK